jgi:hypothetical protein
VHPLMNGHPHRCSTHFEQTLPGGHLATAGCWVSTSPSEYVTALGEAGVPTLGLEGGVGYNPPVTFDGKVRNLGPCVLKFDSLPENHRAHILSTADSPRHHCKLGGGSASITGTTVYRGSKRGRRVARRPRLAKSDCPTTGDRGEALTLVSFQ